MRPGDWRVRVLEGPGDFLRNNVRLVAYLHHGDHYTVLNGPVSALTLALDAEFPAEAGLVLPRDVVPELIEGINLWQGKPTEPRTEAAVLREWLAVERGRVDRMFEAVSLPQRWVDLGTARQERT